MSEYTNQFDQPVGFPIPEWEGRAHPPHVPLTGRTCRLEPLSLDHADDLYAVFSAPDSDRLWTYMPYGPFADYGEFHALLEQPLFSGDDPLFYAIIMTESNKAVGIASYLRIAPVFGSIEVGYISYSYALQKQTAATEAMFLMMRHAFDDLGYRRYEWKCDALNAASRQAALRLGFTFEGEFRQHLMYKGRNRDTAWFSITDKEWPKIKAAFESWLAPKNFDVNGSQVKSLSTFRD